MKKIMIFAAIVVMAGTMMTSCSGSKNASSNVKAVAGNPFGDSYEAPCTVYDTETEFAATGIASGPATQKGTLQRLALSNAQELVRQKMQHAYEGTVKTYFRGIGNNKGTDVENDVIGGGNQIIMGIVDNTSHSCLRYSAVDDKGNQECYIAIQISKSKVANAIADNLSKSEKAEVRQNAEDFRKELAQDLKNYKEDK